MTNRKSAIGCEGMALMDSTRDMYFTAAIYTDSPQSSTIVDDNRARQCAGINRHEAEDERALRERISEPLGPEFCAVLREE